MKENCIVIGCDKIIFKDGKVRYKCFVSVHDNALSEGGFEVVTVWSDTAFAYGDPCKVYFSKRDHKARIWWEAE